MSRRLAAVLALAFYSACADSVDDRFGRQSGLDLERFGSDDRLRVQVTPGVVQTLQPDGVNWVVGAWASAPFPTLAFANGEFDSRTVTLQLQNVDTRAQLPVTLQPLSASDRRDTRCNAVEDPSPVQLAPLEPTSAQEQTLTLTVEIPACSALRVEAVPPTSLENWRMVLFGSALPDGDAVDDALAAARLQGADHAVFLGDTVDAVGSPVALRNALQGNAVTVGLTPGAQDARGDWEGFQDEFGQTDFESRVGRLRLIGLDTADAQLTSGQFSLLDSLDAGAGPGILLTYAPPIDPTGVSENSWVSFLQAARGIAALRDLRVRYLASSVAGEHSSLVRNGVTYIQIARDGVGSAPRRMVIVDVLRPAPNLAPCRTDDACRAGEICVDLLCHPACETSATCPADRPTCDAASGACRIACTDTAACPAPIPECGDDGWCEEGTRLSWDWQPY